MSGAFRTSMPKFWRALANRGPQQFTRQFHRRRLVPIRSVFHDFFHHGPRPWPLRLMEENMRNMEKMVDSVMPRNRLWDEVAFSPRAVRDIQVSRTPKSYEVRLEVDGFQPEDLNVKLTGNKLSIIGRIKETDQHGTVTSEFSRSVTIPEEVDLESLESTFTNEGHLVVRGKITGSDVIPERTIEISRETPPTGETGKHVVDSAVPGGEKKN